MMPIPTHLRECVVPNTPEIDESALKARVQCPCGGESFRLLYPGHTHVYDGETIPCTAEIDGKYFFLIKARCASCERQHLLIDGDFHGWNGYVCHDAEQASLPRPPLVAWKCLDCGESEHRAEIDIRTEGEQHFVYESDGEFPAERWPDGFGWFSMSIECVPSEMTTPLWVSYETM